MTSPIAYFRVPTELLWIWKRFRGRPITYLDIGCGNHAATRTKKWLPLCSYSGVDCRRDYNNSEEDFRAMEAFYCVNLEEDDLSCIPDKQFDVIMMCQVIEHLENGLKVLERLAGKLAENGVIYVEYPGRHSVGAWTKVFPFMHFKTDPTHKVVYSKGDVEEVFQANGLVIVSSGNRLDWRKFLLLPITLVYNIYLAVRSPHKVGVALWHVYPRSEYVFAKRPI